MDFLCSCFRRVVQDTCFRWSRGQEGLLSPGRTVPSASCSAPPSPAPPPHRAPHRSDPPVVSRGFGPDKSGFNPRHGCVYKKSNMRQPPSVQWPAARNEKRQYLCAKKKSSTGRQPFDVIPGSNIYIRLQCSDAEETSRTTGRKVRCWTQGPADPRPNSPSQAQPGSGSRIRIYPNNYFGF